jgi:probable F420-dependent oxidoreductase
MANFGIAYAASQDSIPPAEMARWAEAHGFESLWLGEHSHIPTNRKTPFQAGGEVPEYYKQLFDPFVALTAAAAVTTRLKLGTSVCLVAEHHTINLAKTIATLDQVSKGRFLLGIGAGWNAEEMADHGVEFKDRWRVVRERVLAMKEIWRKEVSEYHGKFVNFDSMWCWPKPLQAGGPPVLMGGWSKLAPRRIAEYCDGWLPLDVGFTGGGGCPDLAGAIEAIRTEAAARGRSMNEFEFSVLTAYEVAPTGGLENRIRQLLQLGFKRVVFMGAADPREQQAMLDRYATLIRKFV